MTLVRMTLVRMTLVRMTLVRMTLVQKTCVGICWNNFCLNDSFLLNKCVKKTGYFFQANTRKCTKTLPILC